LHETGKRGSVSALKSTLSKIRYC